MLVVGAGLAGLTVAESLRAGGYDGAIRLLGAESHAPYHRPPLSKTYLLGETGAGQLQMRSAEVLARKNIELNLDCRVASIDRAASTVTLANGDKLAYDGLALCTGARPRPLPWPGGELQGVHGLRDLDDAAVIGVELPSARRVVVIGGGYIGLEMAAVARKLGKQVTVLEAAGRLLARTASPVMADYFLDLHRNHDVDVVLGAQVSELIGRSVERSGRLTAVRCADGRRFACDLVVIGIGVLANLELAQAAGLECDGGIVVDTCSRTSDPRIVAAGDCTAQRLADGSLRRLESVQCASEQAKSAAAALLGQSRPFTAAPWFWSDQYDRKLQSVGNLHGYDRHVLRGDPASGKFSVFYYRGAQLLGIDSINQPAEHLQGRKLIDQAVHPTPEQAADPEFALNSLLG